MWFISPISHGRLMRRQGDLELVLLSASSRSLTPGLPYSLPSLGACAPSVQRVGDSVTGPSPILSHIPATDPIMCYIHPVITLAPPPQEYLRCPQLKIPWFDDGQSNINRPCRVNSLASAS
ncbi:hypothetical protein NPIL_347231 [Nephila pilipes]|uniref:Uncharacterized protein n=1 Tax=Nephila pilipes TaxID=299642 RepID=A0A8X6TE30_NEPPI|nr:hypothetical protein NPIL_347231 [Nephila pilipes]